MSVDERDPIDALIAGGAPTGDEVQAQADPLDPGQLMAWRAGVLPADEAEAVEARLAADPDARATLADLSEPVPDALKARMREVLPTRRRALAWASVLAAAASIVFGVWLARPGPTSPDYELAGPFGGVAPTRSAEARDTYFLPHSRVEIVVRPKARLSEMPPAARVFVSMPGAALRSLPAASMSRAESGAFVVSGTARALLGDAPGTYQIHVALAGDAGALDTLPGRDITNVPQNIQILSATLAYRMAPEPEEKP